MHAVNRKKDTSTYAQLVRNTENPYENIQNTIEIIQIARKERINEQFSKILNLL